MPLHVCALRRVPGECAPNRKQPHAFYLLEGCSLSDRAHNRGFVYHAGPGEERSAVIE